MKKNNSIREQIDTIFIQYFPILRLGGHIVQFTSELEEILNKTTAELLNNKQYRESFSLTVYLWEKSWKEDVDGVGYISFCCFLVWKNILNQCDLDVRRVMFKWFVRVLETRIASAEEKYLEEILFEDFPEDEFLEKKLVFAEKIATGFQNGTLYASWGYDQGKWAAYCEKYRNIKKGE